MSFDLLQQRYKDDPESLKVIAYLEFKQSSEILREELGDLEVINPPKCQACSRIKGSVRTLVVKELQAYPGEWRCFSDQPKLQKAALTMAQQGHVARLLGCFSRFKLSCCEGHLVLRKAARLVQVVDKENLIDADGAGAFTHPLMVLSDQLQSIGDPRGPHLALWLKGMLPGSRG